MLIRMLAALVACGFLLVVPSSPAFADDPVRVDTGDGTGAGGSADVVLNPTEPGEPGGTPEDPEPTADDRRRDTQRRCTFDGVDIACTSPDGTWSNQRQCWVKRITPDPPPGDPRWEGHTEGAVYSCRPPGAGEGGTSGGGFGGGAYTFWVPDAASAPDLVDPVELAEEAIERMRLVAPRIALTPEDSDSPVLVGMNTWLWVDNAGPTSVGPITETATAGSTSVTATAEVSEVTWATGDGSTVTCAGPGTKWTRQQGTGPSPTCGHRYLRSSITEPDRTFDLTATAHWTVNWSGAGQSGAITFTLTGAREVEVTEVQVLQTG